MVTCSRNDVIRKTLRVVLSLYIFIAYRWDILINDSPLYQKTRTRIKKDTSKVPASRLLFPPRNHDISTKFMASVIGGWILHATRQCIQSLAALSTSIRESMRVMRETFQLQRGCGITERGIGFLAFSTIMPSSMRYCCLRALRTAISCTKQSSVTLEKVQCVASV